MRVSARPIAKCKRATRSSGSCFLQLVAMRCLCVSIVVYKKQRALLARLVIMTTGSYLAVCLYLIVDLHLFGDFYTRLVYRTFRFNSMYIQALSRELLDIICAHIYTYINTYVRDSFSQANISKNRKYENRFRQKLYDLKKNNDKINFRKRSVFRRRRKCKKGHLSCACFILFNYFF